MVIVFRILTITLTFGKGRGEIEFVGIVKIECDHPCLCMCCNFSTKYSLTYTIYILRDSMNEIKYKLYQ